MFTIAGLLPSTVCGNNFLIVLLACIFFCAQQYFVVKVFIYLRLGCNTCREFGILFCYCLKFSLVQGSLVILFLMWGCYLGVFPLSGREYPICLSRVVRKKGIETIPISLQTSRISYAKKWNKTKSNIAKYCPIIRT